MFDFIELASCVGGYQSVFGIIELCDDGLK